MGLYEGETSLYFMIAQGDMDTVKWLLENEARFHIQQSNICFAFYCFVLVDKSSIHADNNRFPLRFDSYRENKCIRCH
jgi:hypothetical protein